MAVNSALNKAAVEVGIGVATVATACVVGPAAAVVLLAAGGAVLVNEINKSQKGASGNRPKS